MKLSPLHLGLPVIALTLQQQAWADDASAPASDPSQEQAAPPEAQAVSTETAEVSTPTESSAPAQDDRIDRKMDLRVVEPTAPTPRTDYVHEGFYFRFGVGPGVLYASISEPDEDSAGSAAFAVAANAMVGGSPAPGLAFGVGALAHVGVGGKFNGQSSALFHLNVGPFFDAFPNSKKGFHLGAQIGGSTMSVSKELAPNQLWGGGGTAWLGWDTWVAPEWSAGFHLQSGGSYAAGGGAGAGIFHANLMLTVLNH